MLSRRAMLGATALGGAGLAGACGPPPSGPWIPPPPPEGPFVAGVASGDPRPTGATIWTRALPSDTGGDVELTWEVAADEGFSDLAAAGTATASPAGDHAVTVGVADLDPGRDWYYRFRTGSATSPVGRTRTAPAPGAPTAGLRLAFVSCQMFSEGYFTAYRHLLDEDVDLLLHLGDYIYEYGTDSEEYGYHRLRTDPVDHPVDLEGYRSKYRLYRTDPDLRAAHQQIPMVAIWDDHEVYDDYDRFVDPARRAAAYRAWFEHMPHLPDPTDPTRLYRSLRWGDLADLVLLDLAQYRDPEAPAPSYPPIRRGDRTRGGPQPARSAPAPVARGDADVLGGQLEGARQPQMLQPLRLVDLDNELTRFLDPDLPRNAGVYLNGTQWDGYQAERRAVLSALVDRGITDNVVLTGDIHSWWAGGVPLDIDDPDTPTVAAEFVGGSVTSPSFEQMLGARFPNSTPWSARRWICRS
ncbi:MAG: alkaline phosphatase D family protein [Microthrixaceae bacterium]